MGQCYKCKIEIKFPFECISCGYTFCDEHKYTADHQCQIKKSINSQSPIIKEKISPSITTQSEGKTWEASKTSKPTFTIGQFDIYKELGQGGFGIVYLAYSKQLGGLVALKTFQDRLLHDTDCRSLFMKEANLWIDLDIHPNILRAYFVENIGGRHYIAVEYIAKNEQGLNTLEDYLQKQPPDLVQTVRWAIQFCYGMEHAYSRGLRCHRDIKPSNIMITPDKILKIADFGLAGALSSKKTAPEIENGGNERNELTYSLLRGKKAGTIGYMSPEQHIDAGSCDQRSDIYSFGVVLDEMAMHKYNSFKMNQRFNANTSEPALSAIINRCMEKNPDKRYQTFQELRRALEPLISQQSKERRQPSKTSEVQLEELNNKGAALNGLGRYNEALEYLNKALKINPNHAQPWVNKAASLNGLKRFEEALECFNKALEINPQLAAVLSNKGRSLASLNRHFEALTCYEMALKLNPLHANAWFNKGITLGELGNPHAADECIKRSIEINPLLATATSPDRLRRLF